MTDDFQIASPKGSLWHRWDPHLHTPGTALNDQYEGADPWESFLSGVEAVEPAVRGIGITDYYGIDNYIMVVEKQKRGRLSGVGLIFPNVELRLATGAKAAAINLHLLFSPHDPDHIVQIRRFLTGLTFNFQGEDYRCQRSELILLGRKHKPAATADDVAYREGVNQFKVNFTQLQKAWEAGSWVRENALGKH